MPLPKDSKYAFCIHDGAALSEPFHIRKLDVDGPKFDGGVTTPPLCGFRGLWFDGRDVNAELTGRALSKCCAICAAIYCDREGADWSLPIQPASAES